MITLVLVVFLLQSCGNKTPEVVIPEVCDSLIGITYDNQVKAIINSGCAYNGCHDGSVTAGVFSDYDGMKGRLDNGSIKDRMFNQPVDAHEHMPPPYATGGPTELTEGQLDTILCWLLDGYPEKD